MVDATEALEEAPEGFKLTELGPLPEEWDVATLEEVCRPRGTTIDPSGAGDVPYVGLEHMDTGEPRLGRWGRSLEVKSSKAQFRAGDVLYGKLRPYLDKAVLAQMDGICSTDILVFRVNQAKATPAFLVNVVHSRSFLARAIDTTAGTNYPRTSWAALREFPIPLPPLEEQRAIAHVLSTIQRAIEATERVIAAARQFKRSLMQYLFTYGPVPISEAEGVPLKETGIGPVPERWELVQLGQVARIQSGGTPSRKSPAYWNGQIPWVKTAEIDYRLITTTQERITRQGLDNSSARLLPPGTLLMAMYGQGVTRGRVAVLGIEASTNQACAALVPDDRVSVGYLYAYLSHMYQMVRNLGHGAHQKNLSAEIIRTIPLAVPSIDEQERIAGMLSGIESNLEAEEKRKTALKELFRTMLHLLMTGQVRVEEL